MFLLDDGSLATSAQDLRVASECEFALLHRLDVTLGRSPREVLEDPMAERLAELGNAHEERELARLQELHPDGVVVGERPRGFSRQALEEGMAWTVQRCAEPAVQVVHQAPVLLTGTGIVPDADFTLREDDVVSIAIEGVGTLRNRVVVVGSGEFEGADA